MAELDCVIRGGQIVNAGGNARATASIRREKWQMLHNDQH